MKQSNHSPTIVKRECDVLAGQGNCSKPIKKNGSLHVRSGVGHSCSKGQNAYVHRRPNEQCPLILSKYRVDGACLSEVYFPQIGSRAITKPGCKQRYWLYHYEYFR